MEIEKKQWDPILLMDKSMRSLRCLPISVFDETVRALNDRLILSCEAYLGWGLAAPQIGIALRAAIIRYEQNRFFMANPVVLSKGGGASTMNEGCLSVPGADRKGERIANQGRVTRTRSVTIQYLDEFGEQQTRTCDGILSHVVQHEVDHLNRVFVTDRAHHKDRVGMMLRFNNFKTFWAKEVAANV